MAKFGPVGWNEGGRTSSTENKDFKTFEFVRLSNGDNEVRFITSPYLYRTINYKNEGEPDKKAKKVKIAYPGLNDDVTMEQDPALQAGFSFKTRYYAGVIDRKDGKVKILDMSNSFNTKISAWVKNPKFGVPTEYDVCINKNDKNDPNNYYSLVPYSKEPLSPEDEALVRSCKTELEESLLRLSAPLSPEAVLKKMQSLGYKGGVISEENARFKKDREKKGAAADAQAPVREPVRDAPKDEAPQESSDEDDFDSDFDFN